MDFLLEIDTKYLYLFCIFFAFGKVLCDISYYTSLNYIFLNITIVIAAYIYKCVYFFKTQLIAAIFLFFSFITTISVILFK